MTTKKLKSLRLELGAGDRGRTGTLSPGPDFESGTSANSITPAHNIWYYIRFNSKNQYLFKNNFNVPGKSVILTKSIQILFICALSIHIMSKHFKIGMFENDCFVVC